jgi:hypothetical protein
MSETLTAKTETGKAFSISDHSGRLLFLILAGIVLPLIALGVELGSKMCATELFDPIPTLWHLLLVGFVPVANIFLVWSIYNERWERLTLMGWASGLAAAVSLFYSIIFAPLAPLAVIAIIFGGIGFLPLSPLLALWATLLIRKYILLARPGRSFPFRWAGLGTMFFLVAGIIALSESSLAPTRYGMELAGSGDPLKQEEGLRFLRKYGDENYLLKMAHGNRGKMNISEAVFDFFRPAEMPSTLTAQEVYYRLTGRTFDEAGKPARFGFESTDRWKDERLTMIASQMDGSLDNDAMLGYLEWTFIFKNSDLQQKEAFGQIQLPPDGVVSRLTLWINGEEREAAFAEKGRVTRAYETVTATRRDPVLVTTAGRDRVNMRCFPVQPNGGEMKVRIGITFPLVIEDEKNGLVRLPYFRDSNFKTPAQTRHIVWIESKKELQSANSNLKSERAKDVTAIRGALTDIELTQPQSALRAVNLGEFKHALAKDENNYISQTVEYRAAQKPSRFVFVVDASANFKDEKENIVSAIKNLPAETEVGLVITHGNGLNPGLSYPHSFVGQASAIAEKIKQVEFAGGTDNLPALTKAWDLAAEREGSVVIWAHAPQPYKFSASPELMQRLFRRPHQTEIYSISNAAGLDLIERELEELNYLKNAPRFSDFKTDLDRLVGQLNQSKRSFHYVRSRVENVELYNPKQASKHLIRLWANDEVTRLLAAEKDEKKAIELAVKYQLVTPVTGAVVLETQQQYDQFGLKPVDKNSVPTIPEPETYLLMAVVLGVLLWLTALRKLF